MESLRQWKYACGFIALWMIIGAAAGGCGKESASNAKPVQACDLLTRADVEAVLGASVDEPRGAFKENQKQQFWMSTCDYFSPATSRRLGLLIQKSQNADPAKAYEAHRASLIKALGEKQNLKTIEGVGARALWDGSLGQLTVFEGQRMLIVTTGGPGADEEKSLETAKAIAAKVLSYSSR